MKNKKEIAFKLGLSESEYHLILDKIHREPNFTELCMFSALWSEHCSYKNSKNLLKNLYSTSERLLAKPGEENAGVLKINDELAVVFKIESHNHPSALEPYQGAATGVGGIMRDIFTMGARPIATLNSLRFGDLSIKNNFYLQKEVIRGIGDYGNSLGIACVGGEIFYHHSFTKNPLVNAMAIGIVSIDKIASSKAKGIGNFVVYVGAKTGKDGVHGASFASKNLSKESESERSAVQVGDPFMEKLLMEATLECIEKKLIVAIQDMGAAGLLSSSSEMAASGSVGMQIHLDKIPTRDTNMQAYEYLLSESQERMLLVIEEDKWQAVKTIFSKWKLNAVVIGETLKEETLNIYFHNELIASLPPKVLSKEAPSYSREVKTVLPDTLPHYSNDTDINTLNEAFKKEGENHIIQNFLDTILEDSNFKSKKFIYEQYDTQIGLHSIIAPGQNAGVFRVLDTNMSLVATVDGHSHYVAIDPYLGAQHNVAESFRNIVSTGGSPIGITNCLNFGNPYIPENYYYFKEAVQGMSDAAEFFKIPIISGNVSFYNESDDGPVLPTPTIGMVGVLKPPNQAISIVTPHNTMMYLVGNFQPTLNSSLARYIIHKKVGSLPKLNLQDEKKTAEWLHQHHEFIVSCIDLSLGGLFIALNKVLQSTTEYYMQKSTSFTFFENTLKSIQDKYNLSYDNILLGETASTYLVGVHQKKQKEFKEKISMLLSSSVNCIPLGTIHANEKKNTIKIAFAKNKFYENCIFR